MKTCWYVFDRKSMECVYTLMGFTPSLKDLEDNGYFAVEDVEGLGGPGDLMYVAGQIRKKVMLNGPLSQ